MVYLDAKSFYIIMLGSFFQLSIFDTLVVCYLGPVGHNPLNIVKLDFVIK